MTTRVRYALAMGLAALWAVPAAAWGPIATESIVTMAARVVAKDQGIQLANLMTYIRDGAKVTGTEREAVIPAAGASAVSAVQSEVYLLQAVRGQRVDPYFAYRLGVLGNLVASMSAPLATADTAQKDRYYADAEGHIQQAVLSGTTRLPVDDAPAYFGRLRRIVSEREALILEDYRGGAGFQGVALAALPEDASRSLNAVADTWYTILTGRAAAANVSQAQMRDYFLDGIEFYIRRNNLTESENLVNQLKSLDLLDPDLQKRVGDTYYDANQFDRAMNHYKAVLAANPGRRDVVERIAQYYIEQGDNQLEGGNLQAALTAYEQAVDINPLNEAAERKRLEAANLMKAKELRMDSARSTLDTATKLETRATDAAQRQFYAEAIKLLKEAQSLYGSISDEFPVERQQAQQAHAKLNSQIQQLMRELVSGAQRFSGSGASVELRQIARANAHRIEKQALEAIVDSTYDRQIQETGRELRSRLDAIEAP